MEAIQTALLLALVVKALVGYLKMPLVNTPGIVIWMVKHGLAYVPDAYYLPSRHASYRIRGKDVVIWFIPYVTFVLGLIISLGFQVDLITQYVPGAGFWQARLLTGIIIGCGSNLIHDVTKKS